MAVGSIAVAVVLAAALFALVSGCGQADLPAGGGAVAGGTEGSSTTSTVLPQVPPIDLLAPTEFETASFALG